jgi:peptidoglycan/xylan/chitin deacetylase (PgdA/CDA1 family)
MIKLNKKILAALIIQSLLFMAAMCDNNGTADNNDGKGGNNGNGDIGDIGGNGEYDLGTKAGIEAYINDHWQEYGYSTKPVKYIALSFDDGPSGVTQSLISALEAKKVKASFFLIGQNIRGNRAATKAIFDAGHELGNHSDGYGSLGNSQVEAIRTSLTATSNALKEITGKDTVLFRAPNVNYGDNLTQICTELGLSIIGVSVWSNDWQDTVATPAIITNVVNNSSNGGIINCHELAKTVDAVPAMIDGLREKGFWIMTVSELAIVKGKTLQAGTRYDSL